MADEEDKKTPKKGTPGKAKNEINVDPELEIDPSGDPVAGVSVATLSAVAPVNEAAPPLTLQQRMKRAQVMRRIRPRLKRAKEIASRRMAPDAKLQRRAQLKARNILRARILGPDKTYNDLDPSSKIRIDKMMQSRKAAVDKLAKRIFPRVKAAERQRLSQRNTVKESVEIGLDKKAAASGLSRAVLGNIYEEAVATFVQADYPKLTAEQYGFGTVNKHIAEHSMAAKLRRNMK